MPKLTNLTTLENLWGVVYFDDDGSMLCTDFLEAADYFAAADQALDEADGGEFQLIEGIDIIGALAPEVNRTLFGPSIYLLMNELVSRPISSEVVTHAKV